MDNQIRINRLKATLRKLAAIPCDEGHDCDDDDTFELIGAEIDRLEANREQASRESCA